LTQEERWTEQIRSNERRSRFLMASEQEKKRERDYVCKVNYYGEGDFFIASGGIV
jgi:hypothetical protein